MAVWGVWGHGILGLKVRIWLTWINLILIDMVNPFNRFYEGLIWITVMVQVIIVMAILIHFDWTILWMESGALALRQPIWMLFQNWNREYREISRLKVIPEGEHNIGSCKLVSRKTPGKSREEGSGLSKTEVACTLFWWNLPIAIGVSLERPCLVLGLQLSQTLRTRLAPSWFLASQKS